MFKAVGKAWKGGKGQDVRCDPVRRYHFAATTFSFTFPSYRVLKVRLRVYTL